MKKRLPVNWAIALLAVLCCTCCKAGKQGDGDCDEGRIHHVILIVVDTLRADALSSDSEDRIDTPNIDRLTADSVVFTRARSTSSWTFPSMCSILTGFHPSVHKATKGSSTLPLFLPTWSEHMSAAGYRTIAVGNNGYLKKRSALDRGFDEYYLPIQTRMQSEGMDLPRLDWLELPWKDPEPKVLRRYTATPSVTNYTIDWIEKNRERDFFMWVHFLDPHIPYHPPPRFRPEGPVQKKIGSGVHARRDALKAKTDAERRWVKGLYDGEIRWVDESIGRILDRLEDLGIYDDSLIVLTSDHGEEFLDHGGYEHGHTLYEELIHVPLMIKLPFEQREPTRMQKLMWWQNPAVPTHSIQSASVSNSGIMPTVLDLCGIDDYEQSLRSQSLISLLPGALGTYTALPMVSTGLLYGPNKYSVVTDDTKYIVCPKTGKREFYDLIEDPDEQTSMHELHPDAIEEAERILELHEKHSEALRQKYKIEEGDQLELDEDTLEELKALGYVL